MKVYCEILGFVVDQEAVCMASGNHPLCRKCLGLEDKSPKPEPGKREARKRCECGREYQARFRKKQKGGLGVRV
jgi:hypothetical protein